MTILVTGGAGYIGSHMVWRLFDEKEPVVVLDDLSTGFAEALPPDTKLHVGDVGDEALLSGLLGSGEIDAVIHFAGSVVVPDSVADPLGYYLNNTVKSRALMAACVAHGVKNFLFSSTAAVYGNTTVVPVPETAPLDPQSPYGTSKLMTETMLRDTARAHDFRFMALRYFNVAGADPEGRTGQSTRNATHLIKVVAEAATGIRDKVLIFGDDYDTIDGTGVRDYIHVSDLVDAHYLAIRHLRGGGDSAILNCGYGRGYSVKQVIATMGRVAGKAIPFEIRPRRPGDCGEVVAEANRIRELLGWQPRRDDLETILRHAYDWESRSDARRLAG